MKKLRDFKKRISVSVDKIPHSHSPRQCQSPLTVSSHPISDADIHTYVTKEDVIKERPKSSADFYSATATHSKSETNEVSCLQGQSQLSSMVDKSPLFLGEDFPMADEGEDLIDEVLREVDKITVMTEELKQSFESKQEVSTDSHVQVFPDASGACIITDSVGKSSEFKEDESVCASFVSASSSAVVSESITSGYFSDSFSEDVSEGKSLKYSFFSRKKEAKKSTDQLDKKAETSGNPVVKKESIYSRIIKSKKKNLEVKKEPIYAKIRPKHRPNSTFKPIEPENPQTSDSQLEVSLVKPEPLYKNMKKESSVSPVASSVFPGGPGSSFAPLQGVSVTPPPRKNAAKRGTKKSSTLPFESMYSKVVKKNSNTLPRDQQSSSPNDSKQVPIYSQPLPKPPAGMYLDASESVHDFSPYGKVKISIKEVTTFKPSIITISNPGYAATPVSGQQENLTALESELEQLSKDKMLTENKEAVSSSFSLTRSSKDTLDMSESSAMLDVDSDTESTGKTTMSKLIEELSEELESVGRRMGKSANTDSATKKEMLSKLLAAYDVPKNLQRVKGADYVEIKNAEKALLSYIKSESLRHVEDTEETVYADVPDYSQDEFVIALDDENDPKYASLTDQIKKEKTRENSPGRASHRSAQMYNNVVHIVSALKILVNSNSAKAATVINRMSVLARPYTQRVQETIPDTSWIQRRLYHKTGHHGFDELRKYIKSGSEFCKELAAIMHERAELETAYAKGLHKLSVKLLKASREAVGTVNQAWQMVGAELESEGDIHRVLSTSVNEEVVQPLRQLIEAQHRVRKGVESIVDKTTKTLHDWRSAESKAKKGCYVSCRENEKIQDVMLEARLGRGKTLTEKEILKIEKQKRKAEESVQKNDLDYYSCCVRAERSRLEWESSVYKGSGVFQTLEEERLQSLKDVILKYHKTIKEAAPKMVASANRLDEPVETCDVEKDIQTIINAKGSGENVPEQVLPDFYAEDINNVMNKERRKDSLEKFLRLVRTDLERERRGKQGVQNLAKALQETPTFGNKDSQQDVNERLQHMKAMLAYLEAARYKVQCSLDELQNRPKGSHPLAKHIEVHRDKQGVPTSILKVPPWIRGNSVDVSPASDSPTESPNWTERGNADGNSGEADSDFDEFSSQGSDRDCQGTVDDVDSTSAAPYPSSAPASTKAMGRCKALYDYEANMYDELTIKTGDIINIHEKQLDGWWVGELEGVLGIFPATYVEEID